jgi:hypothetical protein
VHVQVRDGRKNPGKYIENAIIVEEAAGKNTEGKNSQQKVTEDGAGTSGTKTLNLVHQQNQFEVLQNFEDPTSPRALMRDQDRQLEDEINDEIEQRGEEFTEYKEQ